MKRGAVVAVVAALALAAVAAALQVDVAIDAKKPLHAAASNLWGIFYEEINHSGVGGFYSQLIQNPMFQANTSNPWASSGCTSAKLDSANPLNSVNVNSFALRVSASAACTITNGGYYGIAAKPKAAYRLSFFALLLPGQAAVSGGVEVTVGLRSANGATVYAEQVVLVQSSAQWLQYSAVLHVADDVAQIDASAQFFLTVPTAAAAFAINVHSVLLYPDTVWRGLPWIRQDLGDLIAAMNPTFIRFPGGNYVEGNNIPSIMRWKNTVGPLEERPGHQGTWGYHSPDHFGFYENLLFAEALGADPVWVVNCGMTFGGMVPVADIQPYIQDALDGIEFANGAVTTKYGALRAQLGHAKPFNVRHIAIGNEEDLNGYLPDYKLRYPLFYSAIKAAYPDMLVIANTIQVKSAGPVDIQEIHLYTTPESYYGSKHTYDNYPRDQPIFLSEYAVAGDWVSKNNSKNFYTMRAALGEAVFMTMLERNSDVVLMACYAPLLVQANNHAWDPDAIVFDSYRAYGSPSYWNQVMFGAQPGKDVLAVTFDDVHSEMAISATSRPAAAKPANSTFEIVVKAVNYGAEDITSSVTLTLPAAPAGFHQKQQQQHRRSSRHHVVKAKHAAAAGAWTVSSSVSANVMSSADEFAVNSFTAPTSIAPVQSTVTIAPVAVDADHVKFAYTFPAHSIHVLVLTVALA